jgi:hypothetical protein
VCFDARGATTRVCVVVTQGPYYWIRHNSLEITNVVLASICLLALGITSSRYGIWTRLARPRRSTRHSALLLMANASLSWQCVPASLCQSLCAGVATLIACPPCSPPASGRCACAAHQNMYTREHGKSWSVCATWPRLCCRSPQSGPLREEGPRLVKAAPAGAAATRDRHGHPGGNPPPRGCCMPCAVAASSSFPFLGCGVGRCDRVCRRADGAGARGGSSHALARLVLLWRAGEGRQTPGVELDVERGGALQGPPMRPAPLRPVIRSWHSWHVWHLRAVIHFWHF